MRSTGFMHGGLGMLEALQLMQAKTLNSTKENAELRDRMLVVQFG